MSVLEDSAASGASVLAEVLDGLIERHASDQEVVAAARQEYDDRRGRVFEDEELWERWSEGFLEWFVVERVPAGEARPLVASSLLAGELGDDGRRLSAARALLTSHRSLFEVRSLRAGAVHLLDILGGAQFDVAEKRAMHGVSAGDVIEARLVGFEGRVLFGRTFTFHPSGSRPAIVRLAQRILAGGGDRREVIDYCASLRIRCERYRHVSPVRVYEGATAETGDALKAAGTR